MTVSIGRAEPTRRRWRLFTKYVFLCVAVVAVALAAAGGLQAWVSYGREFEFRQQYQQEQAEATAERIGLFFEGIRRQLGWTTQIPAAMLDPSFTANMLLRQEPAISEVALIDSAGREQARVFRTAMNIVGSGNDLSTNPAFTTAAAGNVYYSAVYYRRESEPYITIAQPGSRRDVIVIAEVNLKYIWDVISQIKVGETGYAYVVDADGHLVAHSDLSLVLRNLDFSDLPQVADTEFTDTTAGISFDGTRVVAASAPVPLLNWRVLVELPFDEALAPVYASILRTVGLLLIGLVAAIVAGLFLSRRMIGPVRELQSGALQIGSGDLGHRIAVRTGDELQDLAESFNDMAGRLEESRAGLERRVAERTAELARSVEELRALGEVSQTVNSTLDRNTVLTAIVTKAVQLSGSSAGGIHEFDDASGTFRLIASYGSTPAFDAAINSLHIGRGETAIGAATSRREPVQVADVEDLEPNAVRDVLLEGNYHALLAIPLLTEGRVLGALVIRRQSAGAYAPDIVSLVQTLASQSAIAIRNAQLFGEVAEKGRLLEQASAHKSQFLANMSHELRTPLNAILGFTELLLDGVYGILPAKAQRVAERLQANASHLLGLINDVLDLSKIEAGQLTLTVEDYSLPAIVRAVMEVAEPLAKGKALTLTAEIPDGLPAGRGDERRLRQVLLNLVGNAVKFTETGFVRLEVTVEDQNFVIAIADSGPGIAPEDLDRIFLEFQQVDSSSTRSKGGSGLGLPISRHIIQMHGGSIAVRSNPGAGSVFTVTLPMQVAAVEWAA